MSTQSGHVYKLSDYCAPHYLISHIDLIFRLDPTATRVKSTLNVQRSSNGNVPVSAPLILDGVELTFIEAKLNGKVINRDLLKIDDEKMVITHLPEDEQFIIEIETEISPQTNTTLMGLYRSNGIYCSQCEAEGFRRITYFPDRPDILATYDVRIEAKRNEAPFLLSNGNPTTSGSLDEGWHYASWHDPFPKPSYLFALVAGKLACVHDEFVTKSGRTVDLGIYVEEGKQDRVAYAMDALKRSMLWEEQRFGLEYDLDVFNIVAVSDFNMGAMENKGLNVFNDKFILANKDTATDADYARIEAIIAHEYFHNWTGNRITCRDWFQLCLKEGLTVFRDHEFSADQRSRAVTRISEVTTLKAHQFPEDAGPLSHPVRPQQYREINNFYTATVYEKGSEVVRMLQTILGEETFNQGLTRYIEDNDGTAATIEDFLRAFETVSGRDLSQFSLWYHQSGTPNVIVKVRFHSSTQELALEFEQHIASTPDQTTKQEMHIPITFGFISPQGTEMQISDVTGDGVEGNVIHLKERKQRIVFHNIPQSPAISLLRGFSAPIHLTFDQSDEERLFLARHDKDLYARWQAINQLLNSSLCNMSQYEKGEKEYLINPELIDVLGQIATDESLEPAFRALVLNLPSESDIAREVSTNVDPDTILSARQKHIQAIANAHGASFKALSERLDVSGPFSPDSTSAGLRALRNGLMIYITHYEQTPSWAAQHFENATNMTDLASALQVLCHHWHDSQACRHALQVFEERFSDDPLVMDKWFNLQATIPGSDTLARVKELMNHPSFTLSNPNRARALVGAFAMANQTAFHRIDGEGYKFLADIVLKIGKQNPSLAGRLATAFRSWRSFEPTRQGHARVALQNISKSNDIPVDVRDIIERTMG